jgi:plasmid stability protein
MAQLIVRRLEKEVVQKLREQAAKHGISMEEQHRRILRKTLLEKKKSKMTFGEFLVAAPRWDDDFVKLVNKRDRSKPRPVNLE